MFVRIPCGIASEQFRFHLVVASQFSPFWVHASGEGERERVFGFLSENNMYTEHVNDSSNWQRKLEQN